MPHVTPELVRKAYAALASGDLNKIKEYWAEDMNWLVPGLHQLAGWYHGRDAFLGFMSNVGKLTANSFNMEEISIMTNDEYSADVTHNVGYRDGWLETGELPYGKLDIKVVHVLRWRNGQVIEGKGAIFGDGTTQFNQFWSPLVDRT
ncbi:MAG TPA: nuclear transport factor 2 family protein [Ktedonosporobacter sp.]|nr:nuclear transport factor 2 family protein [Ktedonosporobacter sp.]